MKAKSTQRTEDAPVPGILADHQIREAIDRGWLEITPFREDRLQPATYDLGVGDIAVLSTDTKPVDLRRQPLLTIEAYASALLQTDEILSLSQSIVGRPGPMSNLLRHGIFVSAGPQIDPGFKGRLFVTLLNITDHPFLIRHHNEFLSVEFHALSRPATRGYEGRHQGVTELSEEDMNVILGRGGASLKEIHRALLEVQNPMKDAAAFSKEIPGLVDAQISTLEKVNEILKNLRESRESQAIPLVVPVLTLSPEPYELTKPISVVVQVSEGGFTATFFDANISASGETQEEAVANFKSFLIDLFEDLGDEPPESLGPEPLRQSRILREFLRKTSA